MSALSNSLGIAGMGMPGEISVRGRIDELRGDFDQSFAEPARSHDVEHVELLAVGAGGRPYALRLSPRCDGPRPPAVC